MMHGTDETGRRATLAAAMGLAAAIAGSLFPHAVGAQETEIDPRVPIEAEAQDLETGPDVAISAAVQITSRFIYRGNRLGDAAQVQPALTLTAGRFDAGLWGSHPMSRDEGAAGAPAYKEAIAWVAYRIPLLGGTLVPYVQSHYSVSAGDFLDADAHFIQTQLSWVGPESLPLDLMTGVVVANDPDNSVYMEAGYSVGIGDLGVRLFAGGTPAASPFNGTDEAALTNVGVSTSWPLELSPGTTVFVGSQFIVNPYTGQVYPVVSLGI